MTEAGRGSGAGEEPAAPVTTGGLRYHRVLLKLSGEALLGERQYGVDPAFCSFVAHQVATIHAMGVQVGIVVGGGNIFRGLAASARGMGLDFPYAESTGVQSASADFPPSPYRFLRP